jgi:hypothetical protein
MNFPRLVAALFAVGSLGACASITPVPYTLAPERSHDPVAEATTLIKSNVVGQCIAEPSFEKPMLIVKFVCSEGVGNSIAKMDRVANIHLEQSGEWYRVVVHHKDTTEDFTWSSKSLEDMQRLADALDALSQATVSGVKATQANQVY